MNNKKMKKKYLKNKSGMTLLEMVVSMGIFAIIMTITVSFFLSLQRLQILHKQTSDLQQEGRVISEIFSRFAKDAREVVVQDSSGGEICSTGTSSGFSYSNGEYNYIAFKMQDDSILIFACYNLSLNKRELMMANVPAGTFSSMDNINTASGSLDFSTLSGEEISINSFVFSTSATETVPKSRKFNIRVENSESSGSIAPIAFPGFIIMKNET